MLFTKVQKPVRSLRTYFLLEPLLTQNKSFFVYIYKDIGISAQRVYVVKSNLKKTEFLDWFQQEIGTVLEDGERQEILLRLLEHEGISRLDWAIAQNVELDKEVWKGYIQDLKNQKPIQYILGYEYFAGQKFEVNASVLIPRPETEELVDWIVKDMGGKKQQSILEVGTGSGCIAISLAKGLPLSQVTATDISSSALAVAKKNAERLEANVRFLEDDILNSALKENQYNIIVSNPPYIPIDKAVGLDPRVKKFEPGIALFTAEKKPLQFYEAILHFAIPSLNRTGLLYFEVHEDYAQQVLQLAVSNGFKAEIRNDFYGKERMVCIKKASL